MSKTCSPGAGWRKKGGQVMPGKATPAGVPGSADLVLPSGKQGQALNPQIHFEDKKGHHVNWVVCPLTRKLFNF